jgi:hypothetical protein
MSKGVWRKQIEYEFELKLSNKAKHIDTSKATVLLLSFKPKILKLPNEALMWGDTSAESIEYGNVVTKFYLCKTKGRWSELLNLLKADWLLSIKRRCKNNSRYCKSSRIESFWRAWSVKWANHNSKEGKTIKPDRMVVKDKEVFYWIIKQSSRCKISKQ